MCVIIYKPECQDIDLQTLELAWKDNQDGAGLAYFDAAGKVIVEKGIMKLEDLVKRLAKISPGREMVVHLRYKTHGITNPHQTHPFAVSQKTVDAKAYYSRTPFKSVLFHNGIINGYGDGKFSDTLEFVTRTLSKIPSHQTRIDVLNLAYGTFAYMYEGENVELIGDYHAHKGCLFSNLHFLPAAVKKGKSKRTPHDGSIDAYDDIAFDYSFRHEDLDNYQWEGDIISERIEAQLRKSKFN